MSFWFCVYILAFYLLLKIKKSVHIVSFVVVAYAILAYFSFVITVYAIIFPNINSHYNDYVCYKSYLFRQR